VPVTVMQGCRSCNRPESYTWFHRDASHGVWPEGRSPLEVGELGAAPPHAQATMALTSASAAKTSTRARLTR